MSHSLRLLTIAFLAAMAIPCHSAGAQDRPHFGLPLACTPGVDCWVIHYMDLGAPGDGRAVDPLCGTRTYDGNKGTAFALANKKRITDGVAVLAARDGTVVRVRDGEPDHLNPTDTDLTATKDAQKECGNAILLDHGNALQSLYCHLKDGSIKVKAGDTVKKGDTIAAVGMSGYTRFPQLHFGLIWEGAVVDPFTGLSASDTCGTPKGALWDETMALTYEPAALYAAGFTAQVPTLDIIDTGNGTQTSIADTASILAFWTTIFGVRANDIVTLSVTAPDGTLFARRSITQADDATRQLYYTGRQLSEARLMPGTYTGTATLSRSQPDGTAKEWSTGYTVEVVHNE
jgi:murein DD-endopeptidase